MTSTLGWVVWAAVVVTLATWLVIHTRRTLAKQIDPAKRRAYLTGIAATLALCGAIFVVVWAAPYALGDPFPSIYRDIGKPVATAGRCTA